MLIGEADWLCDLKSCGVCLFAGVSASFEGFQLWKQHRAKQQWKCHSRLSFILKVRQRRWLIYRFWKRPYQTVCKKLHNYNVHIYNTWILVSTTNPSSLSVMCDIWSSSHVFSGAMCPASACVPGVSVLHNQMYDEMYEWDNSWCNYPSFSFCRSFSI